MKQAKLKRNLCDSIILLHYFGKAVGVTAYSYKTVDQTRTPDTTKRDLFYIFGFLVTYIIMGAYTLRILYNNEKDFEIIPKFAILVLTATLLCLVFIYVIFGLIFRSYVINSLKRYDFLGKSLIFLFIKIIK